VVSQKANSSGVDRRPPMDRSLRRWFLRFHVIIACLGMCRARHHLPNGMAVAALDPVLMTWAPRSPPSPRCFSHSPIGVVREGRRARLRALRGHRLPPPIRDSCPRWPSWSTIHGRPRLAGLANHVVLSARFFSCAWLSSYRWATTPPMTRRSRHTNAARQGFGNFFPGPLQVVT